MANYLLGNISRGGGGAMPATAGTATNPSTYQSNFASLYPNLEDIQGQVSGNTLSRLRGELSPETLNAIQDQAARFGILSGSPGSQISGNFGRKLLGQTVEGLQSQGLQDYLNALKTYSGTLMPTTGETIGAETSRYGVDVGAGTAANSLAEQARQFNFTFPESQRQFDYSTALQNQQFNQNLGLNYAGLGQDYLNSYLQFLR